MKLASFRGLMPLLPALALGLADAPQVEHDGVIHAAQRGGIDLQTCCNGRISGKIPTLVVGKKPDGKSQLK